jgi:hypothetical protein
VGKEKGVNMADRTDSRKQAAQWFPIDSARLDLTFAGGVFPRMKEEWSEDQKRYVETDEQTANKDGVPFWRVVASRQAGMGTSKRTDVIVPCEVAPTNLPTVNEPIDFENLRMKATGNAKGVWVEYWADGVVSTAASVVGGKAKELAKV